MTSKEVYEFIKNDRVDQLYKIFRKSFDWIDQISDIMIEGDLLNEFELSQNIDKATGIYAKLEPVVNALESYYQRVYYNTEHTHYNEVGNVKQQDRPIAKAKAEVAVNEVRDWVGDFRGYLEGAKQIFTSGQSRIKRLTIEAVGKRVGFRGDISNAQISNIAIQAIEEDE